MGWIRRWKVPGSTSRSYTVAENTAGDFGCDCPAWKFRQAPRPDCKHILLVKSGRGGAPYEDLAPSIGKPKPRMKPGGHEVPLAGAPPIHGVGDAATAKEAQTKALAGLAALQAKAKWGR